MESLAQEVAQEAGVAEHSVVAAYTDLTVVAQPGPQFKVSLHNSRSTVVVVAQGSSDSVH